MYSGVNRYTVLPKCFPVSSRARWAIRSVEDAPLVENESEALV